MACLGGQLESSLGTQNIIIDATATPAYGHTGSDITIHADIYTGGFETSGTISQANGAILNDLNLSGGATWNAVQSTWTGSAGATETIDVGTAGTYDATGFTFNASTTVNNSSGGTVVIKIDQGATAPTVTGGSITVEEQGTQVGITLNSGTSSVLVLDDSDSVVQYFGSETGTFNYQIPPAGTGTYKFLVKTKGYAFASFTKSADGIPASFSAVSIYDMSEDALSTQDGLQYLYNGGGRVNRINSALGTLIILGTNVRLWTDDLGASVGSYVQSSDGQAYKTGSDPIAFLSVSDADKIASHQGAVWVDTGSAFSGTTFPNGTSLRPVNNLADAVLIADALGLVEILVDGSLTINSAVSGKKIAPAGGSAVITLDAGGDHTGCSFERCFVSGTQVGTVLMIDCAISGLSGMQGTYRDVAFGGTNSVDSSAIRFQMHQCYSSVAGDTKPVLDLTGCADVEVNIRGYQGGLEVTNCTGVDNKISIDSPSQAVKVASTCTAGEIKIVGLGRPPVDESGAGCDVIVDVVSIDAIDTMKTELVAEHDATQAQITALNDFDPANDTVVNVTNVANNADMRGTDGANTVAPDNATITNIYADTQRVDGLIEDSGGDRFTSKALETSPTAEMSEVQLHSALDSYINKDDWKADVALLATEANVDAVETAVLNAIGLLNNISTAEVATELATYDAPTKAELDATQTAITDAISALNNITTAQVNAEVDTALADYDGPTKAELDSAQASIEGLITTLDAVADSTLIQATLARKHLTNRDRIDEGANTMTRYDDDGTTPLVVFDLKDASGSASTDEIFEKDPQ